MELPEPLKRISVPALDAILGQPFPVLGKGFVRVIDYMGDDSSVVQAARVSYGAGTKKVNEDRGLIRYLMRHRHSTPLEMASIKLHVRVPMDTWRQWIRHRTFSTNEYSTRYSEAIDDKAVTLPGEWRLQSGANKQGSGGLLSEDVGTYLSAEEGRLHETAARVYQERLERGVAREQARKDLPLSTFTEAYWSGNLHNLLHFLGLRMDKHAQLEIRTYAEVIGNEIVKRWVPLVWEAFNDYHPLRGAKLVTRLEIEVLQKIATGAHEAAIEQAKEFGWLEPGKDGGYKSNREREEFEIKCEIFGYTLPWRKS